MLLYRRFESTGVLRHAYLYVVTDIWKACNAFVFRGQAIQLLDCLNLTSVNSQQSKWRYIPEHVDLQQYGCDNHKSRSALVLFHKTKNRARRGFEFMNEEKEERSATILDLVICDVTKASKLHFKGITLHIIYTWGVHVLRSPNFFFSGNGSR